MTNQTKSQKHFRIEYDPERRRLTYYHNDKPQGGLVGAIAERKYQQLQTQFEKEFLTLVNHGLKSKAQTV